MDKLSTVLPTGDMGAVFDALPASHRWVIGVRSHPDARLLSVAVVGLVVVTLTMDGWMSAHGHGDDETDIVVPCAEDKVAVGIAAGGYLVSGPSITIEADQVSDAEISAELVRLMRESGL